MAPESRESRPLEIEKRMGHTSAFDAERTAGAQDIPDIRRPAAESLTFRSEPGPRNTRPVLSGTTTNCILAVS